MFIVKLVTVVKIWEQSKLLLVEDYKNVTHTLTLICIESYLFIIEGNIGV